MKRSIGILVFAIVIAMIACKKDEYKKTDCGSTPHAYTANIKPILNASCAVTGCHVSGFSKGDFTTYAGVKASVNSGKFAEAVLFNKTMPPSGPLPFSQREAIKCWIDNGAPEN